MDMIDELMYLHEEDFHQIQLNISRNENDLENMNIRSPLLKIKFPRSEIRCFAKGEFKRYFTICSFP